MIHRTEQQNAIRRISSHRNLDCQIGIVALQSRFHSLGRFGARKPGQRHFACQWERDAAIGSYNHAGPHGRPT